MPSYGGSDSSGYGGGGESQGGGFGSDGGYGGGGLDGAPDIGTLGGTMADAYGETSSTMPGLSSEQSFANQGVNADSYGYDFNAADMNTPGDWGLGQMAGYQSQQGLPTNQGDFAGNEDSYGFSNFAQSPFGKTLRGVLGMTPFGRVANMGISAALGQPISQIAANAIPGLPGTVARAGLQAYNSPNAATSLGKSALGYGMTNAGGMLGNELAGPVGGMVGGWAGGKLAGMAGQQMDQGQQTAQGPAQGQQGGGFDLGGVLGGLGSLYSGYQNKQISDQMAQGQAGNNQALQGQMSNLAGMYAPNSPYAQQLEQQLARKDAASGRLSQYGPRSVELQARLAAMAPQASNAMSTLAGAQRYDQMRAGNTANTQNLQNILRLAQSSGLTDKLQSGLSGLFGGGQEAPQEQFTQAPSYDMNSWGQNEPPTNWG